MPWFLPRDGDPFFQGHVWVESASQYEPTVKQNLRVDEEFLRPQNISLIANDKISSFS